MMKSKIHRATVTDANLHYVGSVTVDRDLMEAADLRPYEQVAIVEIFEAMDLVHRGHGLAEARHDLGRQLEAQVHADGADVKQQVAGRRHRVMNAMDFPEAMQLPGPRRAEQPIPGVRTDAHHAGQPRIEIAETDGAQKRRQVGAQPANRDLAVLPRIDRDHQKDRGARQFRNDRLWND